ncbi:DMT family transporter [Peribacillus sp. R9-11]|uniref:DMT family transporter n=1 Tax=Peribacillus sp. R9-11 TaxID=3073271 RepID=UPI002869721A|nr:DMT family transporter [Peribacillus sp. R9-11]WMX58752.1 DMT family transporter [Peribacillus sp. R9-11]
MGESFAFLAAFSFGCANVMVKKGTKPNSIDNGTFLSFLITFFLAGVIAIGRGMVKGWVIFTTEGIGWFVIAGILTAFIGRILLFKSIQHLGSVRASAIKRLNPLYESFIVEKKNNKNVHASKQAKAGDGWFIRLKTIASFSYVYGVISAFAYAIGYVVRKEGLDEMPDPYVGTMVGALVGILVFLILSLFQKRYRQSIQSTFSSF